MISFKSSNLCIFTSSPSPPAKNKWRGEQGFSFAYLQGETPRRFFLRLSVLLFPFRSSDREPDYGAQACLPSTCRALLFHFPVRLFPFQSSDREPGTGHNLVCRAPAEHLLRGAPHLPSYPLLLRGGNDGWNFFTRSSRPGCCRLRRDPKASRSRQSR